MYDTVSELYNEFSQMYFDGYYHLSYAKENNGPQI